jgi:hypothetical protein
MSGLLSGRAKLIILRKPRSSRLRRFGTVLENSNVPKDCVLVCCSDTDAGDQGEMICARPVLSSCQMIFDVTGGLLADGRQIKQLVFDDRIVSPLGNLPIYRRMQPQMVGPIPRAGYSTVELGVVTIHSRASPERRMREADVGSYSANTIKLSFSLRSNLWKRRPVAATCRSRLCWARQTHRESRFRLKDKGLNWASAAFGIWPSAIGRQH